MGNLMLVAVQLFVKYDVPQTVGWQIMPDGDDAIRLLKDIPEDLQTKISEEYLEKTGYKLLFTS